MLTLGNIIMEHKKKVGNLEGLEKSNIMYLNFENWLTRFFKDHIRENAWLRKHPSYFLQYKLLYPLHRMLFPYNYIKKGDICVQVGCAEWMFDFGVSMPLVMSAIVGDEGRVIIVEPDQRNLDSLQDYVKSHNINNITAIKKAAWKEKGTNTFTFYNDRSSTNVITEVEAGSSWKDDSEYQNRDKRDEQIEMDTLDNIFSELKIHPDFVNMTINGAEFGAIQGMEKTLKRGVKVSWLFQNRSWWREAIKYFDVKNYDVVVTDSPYSNRAPTENGVVSTYPTKEFHKYRNIMYGISLPRKNRITDSREFPAILYKRKDCDFIVRQVK
jgi:FkbM family methyltransferase